jgi:outer membrane protein assembly factor BamD (BamD/ComL family)
MNVTMQPKAHPILLRFTTLLLSVLLFGGVAHAQLIIPGTAKPPAPPPPAAAGPSKAEIERAAFNACASARTTAPCRSYLQKYPNGNFADTARARIADLEAAQAAAAQRAAQAAADRPPPPPPVDREPQLWAACDAGSTIALCERYLAGFPTGPHANDARTKIAALNAAAAEKSAFAVCQSSTAPGPCEAFVAAYPNSTLVAGAKAQIATIARTSEQRAAAAQAEAAQRAAAEQALIAQRAAAEKELAAQRVAAAQALAAADKEKTAFAPCLEGSAVAACQAYLDGYPNGTFAAQARVKMSTLAAADQERTAAGACLNGSSVAACEKYLGSYPSGASAAAARSRITALNSAEQERTAWRACEAGDAALQCEKYLAAYPAGPSADAARAIIARISKDEASKRAAEAEQAAWDQCRTATNNVLPCQQYLDAHPAGRFVALAKAQIDVIATGPTEDQAVPALGLVVKRNAQSQLVVVSVQGNSTAVGNVFGGDIITTINDKPYNPREAPRAALEAAIAADNGRVELLIMRGAAPVSKVLRARR